VRRSPNQDDPKVSGPIRTDRSETRVRVENRSESNQARRSEAIRLGLLFGAIYFIQGIAEPTDGLIAQPVRSLMNSWRYTAAQISVFGAVLTLPWSFKVLYGLISDFLPIGGSRRRSYLILTTAATVVGLGYLYFDPPAPGSTGLLLTLLLVPTVGVAFSDVVADALMVEKGQPLGLTGHLQAVQWATMYGAMILTGFLGGWLSDGGRQEWGFVICAAVTAVSLVLAVFCVREPPRAATEITFAGTMNALIQTVRSPAVLVAAAFLFLWNFNPFSASVQYIYMTRDLELGEQFYGNTMSLFAAAALVASVAYGFYCRRVPFDWLIHAAIVTGVLSTLAYWGMADRPSAVVVTAISGATYMTGNLIQLDLAARLCPPRVAGTVFALLMGLSNLSILLSTAWGGDLYDRFSAAWDHRVAFNALVAIGALCTAACWLLVPWLRRGREVE
jgi:predicted MFS family arabinose efflux permease